MVRKKKPPEEPSLLEQVLEDPRPRPDRERIDDLLDELGRLYAALRILHLDADTDLPFRSWLETIAVRAQ